MKVIDINNPNLIVEVIKVLNNGGLVIYPTETCYGVGVDATSETAVKKLIEYKERPEGKAISIAVADIETARKYVEINKTALNIYTKFLPGPFTLISKSKGKASKLLEAENGTLGVRIPKFPKILNILKKFGKPISATSANMSGKKTPYTIKDILNNLPQRNLELIDLIIDGGELQHNPPSTVIDTTKDEMKILREGSIIPNLKTDELTISEIETQEVGRNLMNSYMPQLKNRSVIIVFNADMGAGKTQFVKGIAKELNIKQIVRSPTYTYIKEYKHSKGRLIHIDAWKLEDRKEIYSLGIERYIKKGNVIAIEWGGSILDEITKMIKKAGKEKETILLAIEIEYLELNKRLIKIGEVKI